DLARAYQVGAPPGSNSAGRLNWNNAVNRPVCSAPIKVFQCPSAPQPRVDVIGGFKNIAISDYNALNSVEIIGRCAYNLGLIPTPLNNTTRWGALDNNRGVRTAEVTDGLSNTLLLAEDAGRPDWWASGRPQPGRVTGAGWADDEGNFSLHGASADGLTIPGPCAVNCSNDNEIYAFHTGGANVVLGDGSVRFLRASVNIAVVAALITRAVGEVVAPDPF